jgi:cell division protein FtsL
MVAPNIDKFPPERDAEEPTSPKTPVWFKGPLMMYITMVTAFLIVAIFVIHYIIHISAHTL